MKKFIGCVNGTEYTDRGKFNEAVRKATEEEGGTLVITSYETDVEDEGRKPDEEAEQPAVKREIVFPADYTVNVGDETKEYDAEGDPVYAPSDTLVRKLTNCFNRDNVMTNIRHRVETCRADVGVLNDRIGEYEARIEGIKTSRAHLLGQMKYYNRLLEIMSDKKEAKKPEGREGSGDSTVRKMTDVFDDIFGFGLTFSDYLKKMRLFD
jgi:hypothetical protein